MPKTTPKQRRLAAALTRLKELQDAGRMAIESNDLTREQRSALEEAGFIRRVVKGWYLPARPSDAPGDSTAWFAGMRDFIGGYCEARFGERWHLSPAHSLLIQAGVTALPKQVIIQAAEAANKVLDLPEECSLVMYGGRAWPSTDALTRVGPLRVLTVPRALVDVPESFFTSFPVEAQVALTQIRDASDLNRILLEGHPVVAGRLAGALRAAGAAAIADDILDTMRTAGFEVRETNPFAAELPILGRARPESPYGGRMQLLWPRLRDAVLEVFPAEPGLPPGGDARAAYLDNVQATYVLDAYHSLSIEGYRVTEELIRRVASGDWQPDDNEADAQQRDAMAAKGYHDAFIVVKESIAHILEGGAPASVVANEHGRWYRQLFAPSVSAGLVSASDLAGYRNRPVFIKNASHVPPPHEAVRDLMPALFDLLAAEPSAAVRAVLGHFFFVFIHPYMDGNGRMGRFLMNSMLASGGYPWTVIQVKTRPAYFAALDAASTRGEIRPFAEFIAKSLATTPEATPSGAPHENAATAIASP
jgi:hypothetical protein